MKVLRLLSKVIKCIMKTDFLSHQISLVRRRITLYSFKPEQNDKLNKIPDSTERLMRANLRSDLSSFTPGLSVSVLRVNFLYEETLLADFFF